MEVTTLAGASIVHDNGCHNLTVTKSMIVSQKDYSHCSRVKAFSLNFVFGKIKFVYFKQSSDLERPLVFFLNTS